MDIPVTFPLHPAFLHYMSYYMPITSMQWNGMSCEMMIKFMYTLVASRLLLLCPPTGRESANTASGLLRQVETNRAPCLPCTEMLRSRFSQNIHDCHYPAIRLRTTGIPICVQFNRSLVTRGLGREAQAPLSVTFIGGLLPFPTGC